MRKKDIILDSPLGPITLESLIKLEGWRFKLDRIGFPGNQPVITIGGPPVVLADYTDEKGWVLTFSAMFRSPYGTLNFAADNFVFEMTPFLLNIMGHTVPNNIHVWCNIYNPVSALGPIYGIDFTPSYAIPYERRLQVNLSLPVGVPVAQTTVFLALFGKIHIIDERIFLRSMKRHMIEQQTGMVIERYP